MGFELSRNICRCYNRSPKRVMDNVHIFFCCTLKTAPPGDAENCTREKILSDRMEDVGCKQHTCSAEGGDGGENICVPSSFCTVVVFVFFSYLFLCDFSNFLNFSPTKTYIPLLHLSRFRRTAWPIRLNSQLRDQIGTRYPSAKKL